MSKTSILFFLPLLFVTACGYGFQGAKNPLERIGIRRIYVENFRNNSYRPGIERYFVSALVREIERFGTFEVVGSKSDADAVFQGTVREADSAPSDAIAVGRRKVEIASKLNSRVTVDTKLISKDGSQVFAYSVSNGKLHVGAPFGDEVGHTAHLINESEERLAYRDISVEMMAEVYQRLVDVF